jgi:asparagine synthase (glutamine-hydrolysing)
MAEEAARWAGVTPTILPIATTDALDDLERILDDNDDVYIGLPSAAWLIYRELRRHRIPVSLDGHGADELMGAYFQTGDVAGFQLRNAVAAITSRSRMASWGVDVARAAALRARGRFFLRGGLSDLPRPLELVAENDVLPREWGPLNRRLYRMFHATVLPTILRNFDRISMAHGIEVRMPFMDWRLVTYTMALPAESKSSGGYTKMIARRAMQGAMPESIRMGGRKVVFNSPMPEWLNGSLAGWTKDLLDRKVPAFAEIVDEAALRKTVLGLSAAKAWDWDAVGRIWPYVNMKWFLGTFG